MHWLFFSLPWLFLASLIQQIPLEGPQLIESLWAVGLVNSSVKYHNSLPKFFKYLNTKNFFKYQLVFRNQSETDTSANMSANFLGVAVQEWGNVFLFNVNFVTVGFLQRSFWRNIARQKNIICLLLFTKDLEKVFLWSNYLIL